MRTVKNSTNLELFPMQHQQWIFTPPHLPSIVRYADDFTEKTHTIADLSADSWVIYLNGTAKNADFSQYKDNQLIKTIIKAFIADLLLRLTPASVHARLSGLKLVPIESISDFLEVSPEKVRMLWDQLRAKLLSLYAYESLKALLRFAAERGLGHWSPLHLPFIASSLPLPTQEKHTAIRGGDVFLSIDEERKIIVWLNDKSVAASDLSDTELFDTALIICSYQFAMRPKQIGLLRRRDCRVLRNDNFARSVHLTFRTIKQRTAETSRTPLIRKVKLEWAPIFYEIYERGVNQNGDSHLLQHKSAHSVGAKISETLFKILSTERSATELRHSGAMRQVDAGANSEELAEFMGHTSIETGLIYFDTSPSQSERVNQALGISETYQRVVRLGVEKFISADELAALKGEQQIAGVPHGIAITGIGACETGQPLCPFNPVTSCYGCPKFMPINDLSIHEQVLEDFRGVVKLFLNASRNESDSPAFLQLKRTISEVSIVKEQLEISNAR